VRRWVDAAIERAARARLAPEDPQSGAVVHEMLDAAFLQRTLSDLRERGGGHLSGEAYARLFEDLEEDRRSPVSGADPTEGGQAYLPRSPHVSVLQSTLTDCLISRVKDLVRPLPPGERSFAEFKLRETDVFRKFGPCDPDWIESVISTGISALGKPWPFVDGRAPDVELAHDARIVVVGDWGSGLPGAREVGKRMAEAIEEAKRERRQVHALHLGDVYYSGWKEEYESRFMPYWPVQSTEEGVPSWALNGNHDMYSAGRGYFGYLLEHELFAGQRGSSYFSLANSHWQLLGLDSAYHDAALAGDQAAWVAAKTADTTRKTMLLTHHQPFSAFVDMKPTLIGALADAGVRHVDAWLWGHEHLCCVYERDLNPVTTFGSCIGHGGVPVLVREGPPTAGVSWYFDEFELHAGEDRWQLFGYAVLDFDGPRIDIRYYTQNGGDPVHRERLE
jgi:hypothetical protein